MVAGNFRARFSVALGLNGSLPVKPEESTNSGLTSQQSGNTVQLRVSIRTHTAAAIHYDRRLPVVAQIAEHYTGRRDLRSSSALPQNHVALTARAQRQLKNARIYFLPGFLDFPPSPDFFNPFARVAGKGAVFIGVSRNAAITKRGDFTMLGGDEAVYHEKWTHEVATVVARMADDLRALSPEERPNHLVIMGHSKGGLLAIAIKALAICYFKNRKKFPETILAGFPGLEKISREELELVFHLMKDAKVVPIASPLLGLDDSLLDSFVAAQFDRLFHGTSKSFSSTFLKETFGLFGPGYEPHLLATGAVFARREEKSPLRVMREALRPKEVAELLRDPILPAADLMFELVGSVYMPHKPGDSLVLLPDRTLFNKYLEVTGHHIGVVENQDTAFEILRFIVDELFADALQESERLAAQLSGIPLLRVPKTRQSIVFCPTF